MHRNSLTEMKRLTKKAVRLCGAKLWLAEELGVTRATIWNLCEGKRRCSYELQVRIEEYVAAKERDRRDEKTTK